MSSIVEPDYPVEVALSEEDGTITLPEITIIGKPDGVPKTIGDFWCDGYMAGWNDPRAALDRPLMLADQYADAYMLGARAAQTRAQAAMQAYEDEAPAVDVDRNREVLSYEEAERLWREAWEEFLNHREDPHLDPSELRFGVVE